MNKFILLLIFTIMMGQQFVFSDNTSDEALVHYPSFEYTNEQLQDKDFDTIYLVAASPTSESVGSLGAHAFIVLAHGDDLSDSIALNFYAYHERLSLFSKMLKGATTGLVGYIDIRPFSNIAERYTIGQNRTLFLYKTNISKEYIPSVIDKFYEFKESDIRYQFFNYNCSSLLGIIFSSVLSDEHKVYEFPNLIMPGRLVYLFDQSGLLEGEKQTISPPLVKALYDNTSHSTEDILERYTYFKVHQSETIEEDGFSPFIVNFDNFESNTIFSEKVSKTYLGMENLKLSFGVSLFDNQVYEQRQSSVFLYEFILFDTLFSVDSSLNLDKLTLIESGRYPKVNLLELTPSTYYSLKLNSNNNNLDINLGYGISFGTLNTLFTIMPTLETNLSTLVLTLKAKSILTFYTENMFMLLKLDYPIYNGTSVTEESLELKLGYQLNEQIGLEGSYDFLNNDYNFYLKYNFYPLIN
jgi:hypothetical protein